MNNAKEIRQKLWHSLDMAYVRMWLFVAAMCVAIFLVLMLFNRPTKEDLGPIWFTLGICISPIVVLCGIRTFNIFRHPESYHFCKTNLCNPKGGSLRDTIKFTVVLEDADGNKFAADTHSIFSTHRGLLASAFEDYVNQTVTAAYNEETGQVVIIG